VDKNGPASGADDGLTPKMDVNQRQFPNITLPIPRRFYALHFGFGNRSKIRLSAQVQTEQASLATGYDGAR
jgi:hypothetical protein